MPIKIIITALLVSGSFLIPGTTTASTSVADGAAIASLFGDNVVHVDGMSIAEGDIFVASTDNSEATARGLGLNGGFGLWRQGIVPFVIADELDDSLRILVEDAITHWNEKSSISLVPRSSLENSQVIDYVEFTAGSGCASWVGKQGGKQAVWVSANCTTGSIIHEIGHTLGLLHEHTRADRDQYINVRLDNVQSGKEFNFDIVDAGSRMLGDYDYGSVMHYGEYFFSAGGERTLIPFNAPDGVSVGQRVGTSIGDLAAIDQLYGTDISLVSSTGLINDGAQAELVMLVTNSGAMGAHDVQVVVPLGEGATAFSSDSDWSCRQNQVEVRCIKSVLREGESAQVTLTLGAESDVDSLQPGVVSKTFDTDPSNNGLSVAMAAENEPDLGQALAEDAVSLIASSGGGGGMVGFLMMLGLFPFVAIKRLSSLAAK